MNTTTQFLKLLTLCLSFTRLYSCQQECDCKKKATIADATTRAVDLDMNKSFKERLGGMMANQMAGVSNIPRFTFSEDMLPEGIKPEDLDILSKDIKENQTEASANLEATELVTSIFNSLMAAENTANALEVEFTMSDTPVENGSFIFGIETANAQDLTLMMYDEEGFGMVANNKFAVKEGNNYKALNVTSLEPGAYVFKLRNDAEGKELVRRVEITE